MSGTVEVGSLVTLSQGKKGRVRFIGETQFASGEWVGIELDSPDGKNDGSVAGVRYFECPDQHGLFVRSSQVKVDHESSVKESRGKLEAIREKRRVSKIAAPPSSIPATPQKVAAPSLRTPADSVKANTKIHSKLPAPATTSTIAELQKELKIKTDTIANQQRQIEQLMLKIKTADNKSELTEKSISESATLSERDSEIEGLRKQLAEVRDRLASRETELSGSLETTAAEHSAALSERDSEIEGLRKQLAEVRSKFLEDEAELHKQMSELMDSLEAVSIESEERAAKLEEAEAKLSGMSPATSVKLEENDESAESGRLRDALRKLQAIHMSEKKASEENIQSLKQKLEESEKDRLRLQNADAECLRLESKIVELEEEVLDLSQQVDESSGYAEMVESLTSNNQDLLQQESRLQEEIRDLETAMELSEEIDASQRQEISTLRSEIDSQRISVQGLQKSLASMTSQYELQDKKCESLKKIIEDLSKEKDYLGLQLSDDKQELDRAFEERRSWSQQQQALLAAQDREILLQRDLFDKDCHLWLLEGKVSRLRKLLVGFSAPDEEGGRFDLFRADSAEAEISKENTFFRADATVSLALSSCIRLFQLLWRQTLSLLNSEAKQVGVLAAVCAVAESAVRSVAVCWCALDELADGSRSDDVWQRKAQSHFESMASVVDSIVGVVLPAAGTRGIDATVISQLEGMASGLDSSVRECQSELWGKADDAFLSGCSGERLHFRESATAAVPLLGVVWAIQKNFLQVEEASHCTIPFWEVMTLFSRIIFGRHEDADRKSDDSCTAFAILDTSSNHGRASEFLRVSVEGGWSELQAESERVQSALQSGQSPDELAMALEWVLKKCSGHDHDCTNDSIGLSSAVFDPGLPWAWLVEGECSWFSTSSGRQKSAWLQRTKQISFGEVQASASERLKELEKLRGARDRDAEQLGAVEGENRALKTRLHELETLLKNNSSHKSAETTDQSASYQSLLAENKVLSEALEVMESRLEAADKLVSGKPDGRQSSPLAPQEGLDLSEALRVAVRSGQVQADGWRRLASLRSVLCLSLHPLRRSQRALRGPRPADLPSRDGVEEEKIETEAPEPSAANKRMQAHLLAQSMKLERVKAVKAVCLSKPAGASVVAKRWLWKSDNIGKYQDAIRAYKHLEESLL